MSRPADFVLLCHARSGSNLLLWALDHHPDVAMAGEVFDGTHSHDDVGLASAAPLYRAGMDGRDYLIRTIFPPARDLPLRARGFKLFYDHARRDPPALTAWDQLIGDRRIRIIHLVRRNLLDALVSLEVALRSDEWYSLAGSADLPPPVPPFDIAPLACQAYFAAITTWRKWATAAFADHAMLTIDYDALCADFGGAMQQVFAFIGVAPQAAAPLLIRQARTPPPLQLGNYDELRRWFHGTPFAGFFVHE